MRKHTAGPWLEKDANKALMRDSHPDIAIFSGDPSTPDRLLLAEVYCRVKGDLCIDPGPNARLIAAAPDLLAALEGLLSDYLDVRAATGLSPFNARELSIAAAQSAIRAARGLEDQ